MKMSYSIRLFTILSLILFFGTACSSEAGDSEDKAEEVDSLDLAEEELEEDEFEDEDEFDDEEFDDEEDLEDEEYEEAEPEVVPEPVKEVKPKSAPMKAVASAPAQPKPKVDKPRAATKAKASNLAQQLKPKVKFNAANGGWLVQDQEGSGFVVSFKDEDVHPLPSTTLMAGGISHKGKSDWRLPTFDEATYLIDALSLADLTAGQKEFWTSTPKKNGVYVFGLDKTYRLATAKDSCGILLIRSL